jgi:hypothetical protein
LSLCPTAEKSSKFVIFIREMLPPFSFTLPYFLSQSVSRPLSSSFSPSLLFFLTFSPLLSHPLSPPSHSHKLYRGMVVGEYIRQALADWKSLTSLDLEDCTFTIDQQQLEEVREAKEKKGREKSGITRK